MGLTKRVQVLMEQRDFERLVRLARQRRSSVGELLRQAVSDRYLGVPENLPDVVGDISAMNLDIDDWRTLKAEIVDRGNGDVS
jgi:hypothetical protein